MLEIWIHKRVQQSAHTGTRQEIHHIHKPRFKPQVCIFAKDTEKKGNSAGFNRQITMKDLCDALCD